MPRVLQHTPAWLSRGAPGFELFDAQASRNKSNGASARAPSALPGRTIVHRNTQVFAVVGDDLRWADLVNVKELSQGNPQKQDGESWNEAFENGLYKRIDCRIPAGGIKQLVLSPNQNALAVVGSHNINIVQIPDEKRLSDADTDSLKPRKQASLGRDRIHTTAQPAIACVLWHPLGVSGQCIVTITKDAVIRVWEISFDDRTSFDQPTQTIDLRRLADATSSQQDVQGSNGKRLTNTFSPYDADFEPVAACFGGSGGASEGPWSAMTLWIATRDGDIYALSPLLPRKWQASQKLVDGALFLASAQAAENGGDASMVQWGQDLAAQEPLRSGNEQPAWIYSRPKVPDDVPALQGPFVISPEMQEWDPELSDITVTDVNSTTNAGGLLSDDDLLFDDDEAFAEPPEQSSSIVWLSTMSGQIYITLSLEGVGPQWLPASSKAAANGNGLQQALETDLNRKDRQLLALDTVNIAGQSPADQEIRPNFTADVASPFAVFVSHANGVHYLSAQHAIESFREEMDGEDNDFRVETLVENTKTLSEPIIQFRSATLETTLAASIVLQDSDLGYFLLTQSNDQPHAAQLDHQPIQNSYMKSEEADSKYETSYTADLTETMSALKFSTPQDPYHPDAAFYASTHPAQWKRQTNPQLLPQKQLRLSQETLADLTHIHRILADETTHLSQAAADLFRRCEALQAEFRSQVNTTCEIADKVDTIKGDWEYEDEEGEDEREEEGTGIGPIKLRIEAAAEREAALLQRRRQIMSKFARLKQGGKGLSGKEEQWKKEVDDAAKNLKIKDLAVADEEADQLANDEDDIAAGLANLSVEADLTSRLETLKNLKERLLLEAKKLESSDEGTASPRSSSPRALPANKFRRQKESAVRELLEREEALIDAVRERVERLSGVVR